MATEIVRCPLLPGQIPDDIESQAGQILKDALQTIADQPGFQRLYWGREVENPEMLRMFIDWDRVEDHEKFTKDPIYKPFTERLGQILDLSKLVFYHAKLKPHPATTALSDTVSPTTEVLTVWFPTNYNDSAKETFESGLKKLVAAAESACGSSAGGSHKGSAGGWTVETSIGIPNPTNPTTHDRGMAYVAVLGWESVAAHMAFRETDEFKQNVHHLREAQDAQSTDVVHVNLVEVTRGGGVGGGLDGDVVADVQEEILNPTEMGSGGVKTRSDGTTTKNDPGPGGVSNALKKDRAGR